MSDRNALALPPYQMPGSQPLAAAPPTNNYMAAMNALRMTPQEQALYMRHLMNLYGPGGVDNPPTADNPGGSRSTLYTMNVGLGDRAYNLPTVYDGNVLAPDNALAHARTQGLDNFPSYQSPFAAENRYQRMHNYMDRDTSDYFKTRGR